MPQHKKPHYIIQIVGGTGVNYGYIKKMYYQQGKYQLIREPQNAKKYQTFDAATADVDILVMYDISIRALIHEFY